MKKKVNLDIEIVELILVKCGNDYNRTFMGTIKREVDANGDPLLTGTVTVHEGKIYCRAISEDQLCQYLDEICQLKLDFEIHTDPGVSIEIAYSRINLN